MIKENQKYLNKILVIIDAVTVITSVKLAWYIRFKTFIIYKPEGSYPLQKYFVPLALMMPVYIILYKLFNLYKPHRFKSIFIEFCNILKANILGILIFVMVLYVLKDIDYSRYLIFVFFLICTTATLTERSLLRIILRFIRRRQYNVKHILIIGVSRAALSFLNKINRNKQWGYIVDSILGDNVSNGVLSEVYTSCLNKSKVVLDKLEKLEDYITKPGIDEVFITLPFNQYDKLNWVIEICKKAGVRTQIILDFAEELSPKLCIEDMNDIPIISMRYVPLDSSINRIVKRIFDIICSSVCIVIFSPIMLITAIIIKFTSSGPVIFRQERVGLGKKTFKMYKFRSMKVQNQEKEKYQWTTVNDPRKTRVGDFIRKTSIDELPQLFNVLKGDMSLVGPRPERPYFVDKFKKVIPKYMVKHQVRPGITGWAQVNGWRGDTSIEKRIECDIYYIENWRLWLDIKIMFLTLFKGFINKNAY